MNKEEELKAIHAELQRAKSPEDIFGNLSGEDVAVRLKKVREIYVEKTKFVFPDHFRYNDNVFKMAEEAFKMLNVFRKEADLMIEREANGGSSEQDSSEEEVIVFKRQNREYHMKLPKEAEGDISLIYSGICVKGENASIPVKFKVVIDPADDVLMQNEVRILKFLNSQRSKQSKHFPVLIDQFRTTDHKPGLILESFDGYDLYSMREEYKNGIHQRHVAWIFDRTLSAIGYSHSTDWTHNKINPSHIMSRPRDDNVMIVDWSYATRDPFHTGESFKYYDEDYSAPEVKQGKRPTPSSDLYSIGKCMIYALGGDIRTNTMPGSVDERFQRFIRFFVMESPIQRANDAWEMHAQLRDLRKKIWGSERFEELKMKKKIIQWR
ncbi:MAG: hypothetical protein WC788_01840 [Candidatus Paceibacterota bacterium]|jgi:serine/threonine protein kinase